MKHAQRNHSRTAGNPNWSSQRERFFSVPPHRNRRPRTFKHVRHLADLRKGGAVGPGVHHVHQVGLELAQVRLLVHLQLGVGGDLGNPLGAFLTHNGKATPLMMQLGEQSGESSRVLFCARLTCICLRGAASCSVSLGISLAWWEEVTSSTVGRMVQKPVGENPKK